MAGLKESPPRVPASYVRPLLDELAGLGGDLARLWRDAAIDTPLPALLRDTTSTVPSVEFSRLYRASIAEIERRLCRRDGRRPMGKRAMDMLCHCVLPCRNLREVIARAAEFNAMMEDRGGRLAVGECQGIAHFTLEVPGRGRDLAALLVDATGLYFYYQLFSWLIGRRLPLRGIDFVHAPPRRPLPLLDALHTPPRFGQALNALKFPAMYLDQAVVRSDAQFADIVDYFPFDLALVRGRTTWDDNVRLLLLDSLQRRRQPPALTAVAQLLHVSEATLRRRLAKAGTSYAALRAQCRREIAEDLLARTNMPVDDIAARLGFSGDRAFRRAFREWTGMTPTACRQGRRSGDFKA